MKGPFSTVSVTVTWVRDVPKVSVLALSSSGHTFQVHLAHFQNDGQKLIHSPVVHAYSEERFV